MIKPLVYYAISFFLSLFTMLMLYSNMFIGAVIAASFFAILFFNEDKRLFISILLFFFIGMSDYYLFFNIDVPQNIQVRIIENKKYYSIGELKGRKIIITGLKTKIQEGEMLKLEGVYKDNKDLVRGSIGSFQTNKIIEEKKDFFYEIYAFKRTLYEKYKNSLGEEKAAMVMSLCFGDASYLNNSQKQNFKLLGVIHAISVSGFHIALIYKILEKLLGIKGALCVSFMYMFFTGAQAATERAFIMIFIYKGSKLVFKNYDALSALSLSALLILLIKPSYVSDLGFMLSFLATLGIIVFYKKLLRAFYKLPKRLNESLSIMLSAQCFSLPYIAFTIKSFSGGFILGNLVLLPIYSLLVIFGNLSALLVLVPQLFNLCNYFLGIVLKAVDGASFLLLKITPDLSYFGYEEGLGMILIFIFYILFHKGYKKLKYLPMLVVLLLYFNLYSFFPKVHYFNIKDNSCFVLEYKYDRIMFCDKNIRDEYVFLQLKDQYKINKIIWEEDDQYALAIANGYFKSCYYNHKLVGLGYIIGDNVYTIESKGSPSDDIGKITDFANNSPWNLYVIIFNRIINIY